MDERRIFPRFDLSVEVNWKRSPVSSLEPAQKIGNIKNISAGGVCLILNECLDIGEEILLDIKLPDSKIIHAEGKVAWVRKFEIIGGKYEIRYETGIQFVDINDATKEEINKIIFNLSRPNK